MRLLTSHDDTATVRRRHLRYHSQASDGARGGTFDLPLSYYRASRSTYLVLNGASAPNGDRLVSEFGSCRRADACTYAKVTGPRSRGRRASVAGRGRRQPGN